MFLMTSISPSAQRRYLHLGLIIYVLRFSTRFPWVELVQGSYHEARALGPLGFDTHIVRWSASLQISGYSSSRILTFYFLTFILFLVFASLYYLFRRRWGRAVEKGKITSGHECIRKRLANDSWVPGLFYFFPILGFLFNVFSNAVGAKTSVSDSYCMKKRRQPVVSCLLFIIALLGKESGETRTEQAGQFMEKKDKMDVILQ